MLQIVIPTDKITIPRQIKALKYALKHDVRDKDANTFSIFRAVTEGV